MRTLWKPVPGYSQLYWVSNKGQVKSYRYWKPRGLASKGKAHRIQLRRSKDGHQYVPLFKDGRVKTVSLAKLMLLVFVGSPPTGKKWACHNDGDASHNFIPNLRWGTNSENQMDRVLHKTSNRGEANAKAKLTAANVVEIHDRLAEGEKQKAIAIDFNVDPSAISNISRGRNWPELHPKYDASVSLHVWGSRSRCV